MKISNIEASAKQMLAFNAKDVTKLNFTVSKNSISMSEELIGLYLSRILSMRWDWSLLKSIEMAHARV